MKRIILTLLSTALIALLGLPAAAATRSNATLSLIGEQELLAVTAGRCITKCDEEDEEEEEDEPDVYTIGYEWLRTSQVDGEAEQLYYSIVGERSNVYGMDPAPFKFVYSDECSYRWTSGGVGITAGFSVSIGRTYYCDHMVTVSGIVQPGFRVKIYKAEMRQVSRVTMSEYEILSDGSSERTGRTDTGRKVNYWSRYSDVPTR